MRDNRAIKLDTAALREDLAAMEQQIRLNRNDHDLIDRYLAYARKVREIEFRQKGYVTARNQLPETASLERA